MLTHHLDELSMVLDIPARQFGRHLSLQHNGDGFTSWDNLRQIVNSGLAMVD